MFCIKDLKQTNESKRKFWNNNKDIFLRYFDNLCQYEALISAGNFKTMQEIVKSKTTFDENQFFAKIKNNAIISATV